MNALVTACSVVILYNFVSQTWCSDVDHRYEYIILNATDVYNNCSNSCTAELGADFNMATMNSKLVRVTYVMSVIQHNTVWVRCDDTTQTCSGPSGGFLATSYAVFCFTGTEKYHCMCERKVDNPNITANANNATVTSTASTTTRVATTTKVTTAARSGVTPTVTVEAVTTPSNHNSSVTEAMPLKGNKASGNECNWTTHDTWYKLGDSSNEFLISNDSTNHTSCVELCQQYGNHSYLAILNQTSISDLYTLLGNDLFYILGNDPLWIQDVESTGNTGSTKASGSTEYVGNCTFKLSGYLYSYHSGSDVCNQHFHCLCQQPNINESDVKSIDMQSQDTNCSSIVKLHSRWIADNHTYYDYIVTDKYVPYSACGAQCNTLGQSSIAQVYTELLNTRFFREILHETLWLTVTTRANQSTSCYFNYKHIIIEHKNCSFEMKCLCQRQSESFIRTTVAQYATSAVQNNGSTNSTVAQYTTPVVPNNTNETTLSNNSQNSGWIRVGESKYFVNTNKVSYEHALKYCDTLGGELVTGNSPLALMTLKTKLVLREETYWIKGRRDGCCVSVVVKGGVGVTVSNCESYKYSICSSVVDSEAVLNQPSFQHLITDMTVNARTTSKRERSLISVEDKRVSAKTMGCTVGVACLAIVVSLVLIVDADRVIVAIRDRKPSSRVLP